METKTMVTRYILAPIGPEGAMEATQAIPFCSAACAESVHESYPHRDIETNDGDFENGTICENCGKQIC